MPCLAGAILRETNLSGANLSRANLSGADLSEADLSEATLSKATLTKTIFVKAKLFKVNFEGASLDGATFHGAVFKEARLDHADLRTIHDIRHADLSSTILNYANLAGTDLSAAKLNGATLSYADLTEADLSDAELRGAHIEFAELAQADLRKANLKGARLDGAKLDGADLRQASVDSQTVFNNASALRCRIERHTLLLLRDYGELTPGARMDMDIEDGAATLRMSFSGFYGFVHLLALLGFLFPYVWFVLWHWGEAKFRLGGPKDVITLWQALLRFIWNGGQHLDVGFDLNAWPFSAFCFCLFYNIVRLVLLWKTKNLELRELATDLPVRFSLAGWWNGLYQIAWWGFWINVVVVVLHTWHFLQQTIPISALSGGPTTG